MKKKVLLGTVVVVFLLVLVGLGIFITTPKKDPEWGITLEVVDISPAEAKIHMVRENGQKKETLYTGEEYLLERWTLRGWRPIEGEFDFKSVTHVVEAEYEEVWLVQWGNICGKLSNGAYRISKNVMFDEHETESSSKLEYKDAFFVVDWWQVIIGAIVLLLLLILVWMLWQKDRRESVKKFVIKRKKKVLVVFLTGFAVCAVTWLILDYFAEEISHMKCEYEVTVETVEPTCIAGEFQYMDDGDNLRSEILTGESTYYIERKTIIGWKREACIKETGNAYLGSLVEKGTKSFELNWEEEYGELSPGTYRIRQPFHVYHGKEDVYSEGKLYITFTIVE